MLLFIWRLDCRGSGSAGGRHGALPSPPLFPANCWLLRLLPETHRLGCCAHPPEGVSFETHRVLSSQASAIAREVCSSHDEAVVNSYSSVQIIPAISWYLQNSSCCFFNSSVQHMAVDFGASSLVTALICGVVTRETEESQVVNLFPSHQPLEIH